MHEQSHTPLSNNVPDESLPIEKIVNYTIDSYFGAIANDTGNTTIEYDTNEVNNWWALVALMLVVCTAAGNVLVCLAIYLERRLQNVTNYFLMSLAITDLLVAILVMPLGILTLVRRYFPLPANYCLTWICLDVLLCTASIMHLCTISVDRSSLHLAEVSRTSGQNSSAFRSFYGDRTTSHQHQGPVDPGPKTTSGKERRSLLTLREAHAEHVRRLSGLADGGRYNRPAVRRRVLTVAGDR